MTWLRRQPSGLCDITPQDAGWTYAGLSVHDLADGEVTRDLTDEEAVVLPLSATNVQVRVGDEHFTLAGRAGVFAAVSDWLYVPVGSPLTLSGAAGQVAVATAGATRPFPVCHVPANQVPIEVRGAGRATRQVTNIATPGSFFGADKINVCEVITPGGNLSSWPPHRHDGRDGCIAENEEIYYVRIGREDSPHGSPEGEGFLHVYSADGTVDDTVTLRDGDAYLVPFGYHGPCLAPPEYPMYYLNVLAGPATERTMAFCDDPTHTWIREMWEDQARDPRLPWTDAFGRVGS